MSFIKRPTTSSGTAARAERRRCALGRRGSSLAALALTSVLAVAAVGCEVHATSVPQGQSTRVYTVEQVAHGLSDPTVGEVDIRKSLPECGSDQLISCPAKVYSPGDVLGGGGSKTISVDVEAGRITRKSLKMVIASVRNSDAPNQFVISRANVVVTGRMRLRDHVLALLQAMPAPTTRLGDITPPRHQYVVHGA
jgi:hypothetical protein